MSSPANNGAALPITPRKASKGSPATKEQYAIAVALHAAKSKEEYLFTGVNYRHFASFLRPSTPTTRGPITAHSCAYVTVQTYVGRNAVTVEDYDSTTGLQSFKLQQPPESNCCQLVFLRGFPSADWLNLIGASYRLDPEFMRRHLDFMESPSYYDLPPLPSSSGNILKLRITTICTRNQAISYRYVQQSRWDEIEAVRKHQRHLGVHGVVGESIVRRFSTHDETTFTVEQNISCCVKRRNGGYVVIIWLDTGRNLEDGPFGPWILKQSSAGMMQNTCQPVIQHRPKGALLQPNNAANIPSISSASSATPCSTFQSASLLPAQYGSTLDVEALPTSALYALSELFSFAAHSESQFLNMIHSQVTTEMRALEIETGRSMDNLRYYKSLVDEHIETISDTLRFIRKGCDKSWVNIGEPSQVVNETMEAVETDFQHLLVKAKALTSLCVEGSNTILQRALLEESKKGLLQAVVVGRLSLLAFFFLPLSFTASLFGMNFIEFGTGTRHIWIFFATLVPTLGLSAALAFPQRIPWSGTKQKRA